MSRQTAVEPGLKHKLDYDDLAHTPNDRLIYELAEGELHVTPSPNPRHQWISKTLQRQLEAYFEGRNIGRVYDAPTDVVLTKHDVFVPDLVVVTDRSIITERAIEGSPLLVVEVLSPGTTQYDRTTKSRRYAALGIEHFWIVDIENQVLEIYRRSGERYEDIARVRGGASFDHPDFPGLTIETSVLWKEP
jgi:Uma2 family endonuclease